MMLAAAAFRMTRLPAAVISMPRSLLVTLLESMRQELPVTLMPAAVALPKPLVSQVLPVMWQREAAAMPSPPLRVAEQLWAVEPSARAMPRPWLASAEQSATP